MRGGRAEGDGGRGRWEAEEVFLDFLGDSQEPQSATIGPVAAQMEKLRPARLCLHSI